MVARLAGRVCWVAYWELYAPVFLELESRIVYIHFGEGHKQTGNTSFAIYPRQGQ